MIGCPWAFKKIWAWNGKSICTVLDGFQALYTPQLISFLILDIETFNSMQFLPLGPNTT